MEAAQQETVYIRCLYHDWFVARNMETALLHIALEHLRAKATEPAISREAARALAPAPEAIPIPIKERA